jgi:peptide/nickel transport system ATP-binding protein
MLPDTVISVRDLTITFKGDPDFIAVRQLSFSVDRGTTLAIVGESGSGKSLTALALMRLEPAQATLGGSISFRYPGTESHVGIEELASLRGRSTGMVFQEPMSSLNPVMSIGRQLREAILVHQKMSKQDAASVAVEWLHRVQLPDPDKIYHRFPHQLSGGQKQRVMIAMAMCNHPALLIADEPTTALDVTVQQEIVRLMGYLQQEYGTAMIFITHDLALAATLADTVLVMNKGEAVEYGPAKQVLHEPRHAYTRALIACKPSPEKKGRALPVVSDFLDGKPFADLPAIETNEPPLTSDECAVLDVRNASIWFPGSHSVQGKGGAYFKAVDDVSFVLKRGEVLGLAGESGCGKSTLSRALVGLLPLRSGSVLYDGHDVAHQSAAAWRGTRRQVQMIFQDPYASLNPRMRIGDMLAEPLLVHGIVPRAEVARETARLLDIVQLPAEAAKRYPHQFSGGQRQRIGIARALSLRPQILICDESVSALDVSIQAQILNLLKDLQRAFQLSYLFISHDLNVVHYISDRVMIMQAGKIIETGTANQVMRYPEQGYTKRLLAAMP